MDVEPRLVFKPLLDGRLKLVLGLNKYESVKYPFFTM
jgi:hypothetical protein